MKIRKYDRPKVVKVSKVTVLTTLSLKAGEKNIKETVREKRPFVQAERGQETDSEDTLQEEVMMKTTQNRIQNPKTMMSVTDEVFCSLVLLKSVSRW